MVSRSRETFNETFIETFTESFNAKLTTSWHHTRKFGKMIYIKSRYLYIENFDIFAGDTIRYDNRYRIDISIFSIYRSITTVDGGFLWASLVRSSRHQWRQQWRHSVGQWVQLLVLAVHEKMARTPAAVGVWSCRPTCMDGGQSYRLANDWQLSQCIQL